MRYEYYNFEDGFIRVNACFDRVLTFFKLKRITKSSTLDDMIQTLTHYGYMPLLEDFSEKRISEGEGIIVFIFKDGQGHVASYRNGVYYDTIDIFKSKKAKEGFIVKIIEM